MGRYKEKKAFTQFHPLPPGQKTRCLDFLTDQKLSIIFSERTSN